MCNRLAHRGRTSAAVAEAAEGGHILAAEAADTAAGEVHHSVAAAAEEHGSHCHTEALAARRRIEEEEARIRRSQAGAMDRRIVYVKKIRILAQLRRSIEHDLRRWRTAVLRVILLGRRIAVLVVVALAWVVGHFGRWCIVVV